MYDSHDSDILTRLRAEFNSIQSRMRESQTQIDQNAAEVKRLEDETGRANVNLRRIHTEFDTCPRSDIRTAYDAVIDVQRRLYTMRSQLEKMQDNQGQLKRYGDLLGDVISAIDGDDIALPSSSNTAATPARQQTLSEAGETIVRIVNAQEEERQSLAKSLHDGPAQSLTNFILQAEVCQRLFDRNPDRAVAELANLKVAAGSSFQKIRDFIFDLRPMMLDDLGLIPTLRRYTENFQQKMGVKVETNFTGEETRRIGKATEVMMFRSIQSLLRIASEYMAAKTVKMQIDVAQELITARLEDDGKGFDPEVDLDPKQGDSNVQSLNAVRDRIQLVGGKMDIFSQVDIGSRFEIVLPIYEEEPEF